MSTYENFVQCRVTTPIPAAADSIGLYAAVPPYSLPSEEGGLLVLTDSPTKPSKLEVISYTSRSALGLYGVARGLEGTTALEWTGPVYCYQSLLAGEFKTLLDSKVDKVSGKGLTDTNYSQLEKNKLADIASEATKNRADSENADKVHTHAWSQVTGAPATATRWPTFTEVTGKPIVQTTGTSTTNLMSQKATTDAINAATENSGGGLGVGQTWQNVKESRVKNTTYTNTTGKPIAVFVSFTPSSTVKAELYLDNSIAGLSSKDSIPPLFIVVPAGGTYRVESASGIINYWSELR